MTGRQTKGQPNREIFNLFATLNQEQQREKHDIGGLYEGRLRSHVQNFEGLKRKWEGFAGVPVPKKLRTSEADYMAPVKESVIPNQSSVATMRDQKPVAKTTKKAKTDAPAKKAAPATMPPHPDDLINVDVMIVNDLRKELRKKGLGTGGRKAELQTRLRQYLAEAKKKREAEWAAKHAAKKKETQIKQVKMGDNVGTSGRSKDVKAMNVVVGDAGEIESEKFEPAKKASVEEMVRSKAKEESKPTKEAMKNPAPKSALKPSKYTSTIIQGTTQFGDLKPAVKPGPSTLAEEDLLAHKQTLPTKVSDSSSESSYDAAAVSKPASASRTSQPSGQKAKISSTLAQTAAGGSSFKAKVGGTGSAKLLEKKKAHAAATEARKARMAEMRQKAKPCAASVSSATKTPTSHSKYAVSSTLKKMASGSTLGESKPNSILAKMREKAAAEKNTENVVPAPTKPAEVIKQNSSSSMISTSSSSTAKRVSQVAMSKAPPKSTALKSILDPANKLAVVSEPPTKPEPPKERPLSPMQTYEMSDRDEESSESESESDEEYERQRPKKSIPEWAQKVNLHRALERQFADGADRLDPDKIFGEVVTCNLEEIFDKKKSRYQRRTSSGNWTKDHVTLAEKLTYKRTMGYDK